MGVYGTVDFFAAAMAMALLAALLAVLAVLVCWFAGLLCRLTGFVGVLAGWQPTDIFFHIFFFFSSPFFHLFN